MLKELSNIIGQKVLIAEFVHDYLQLRFDGGAIINIYNKFRCNGFTVDNIKNLVGSIVSSVDTSEDVVEIGFIGNKSIHIGMLDADYSGPEAMEYIGKNGERVIW